MSQDYTIPAATRIGHAHLKVSDLQRAIDFYCDVLGFELVMLYGDQPHVWYLDFTHGDLRHAWLG